MTKPVDSPEMIGVDKKLPGRLITLEGSEGCGKSTQITLLERRLSDAGRSCLRVREPGGTALGEAIRHLLKHDKAGEGMCPESELLLFCASRAQLVRQVILPALAQGKIVLCDRFYDSSTVYQGIARGLGRDWMESLHRFVVESAVPDLTLILDMDAVTALARARQRAGTTLSVAQTDPASVLQDRMEAESEAFYEMVRKGYLELAATDKRMRVLDASASPEQVHEAVWKEICHVLVG